MTATGWLASIASPRVPQNAVGCRPGSDGTCPTRSRSPFLGQLAVDEAYQGRHLGSDLLIDAARRARTAAGVVGARAIIVQALDERARTFHAKCGFRPVWDHEPLMLVLRMSEVEGLLAP